MEHVNFISEMVTGCLQHISTIKDMILSDPFLTGLSNRIHTYRLQARMQFSKLMTEMTAPL